MSGDTGNNGLSYGEMVPKLEPADTDNSPVVLTVRAARRQDMAPASARAPQIKVVILFAEEFEPRGGDARREYIVNATSYRILSERYGQNESAWVGRQVVMMPTVTQFNGRDFTKMHVAPTDTWDEVLRETERARSGTSTRKTSTGARKPAARRK